MKPEEVNRLNQKKYKPNKINKYCHKCDQSFLVSDYIRKCPVCNTFFEFASPHQQVAITLNVPTCPTCHSVNVQKISFVKGYTHWRAFGLFSKTARSQFECNNCGYKW